MYKKGAGNDKQGKDKGNRTLCPNRNFSQAIKSCKKRPPHYPRIHVIPIQEDILDNLPDLEFQL